jgi:DNA-binding PadR family transcriptional regulator
VTGSELALLGLLAEGPRHAYDLERLIDERQMRSWTEIGFSSIYAVLKRLERQKLVSSSRARSPLGPARRIYRLTPSGRVALRLAVEQALAMPSASPPPLLLGLAYLPTLPRPKALAALARSLEQLDARKAQMEMRRRQARPLPDFVDALFAYSLEMARAERLAITHLLRRLETSPRRAPGGRRSAKGIPR